MAPARNVLRKASPADGDGGSLLSPVNYDDDARSLHSRSDQDTDSEDDELQMNARNSKELRAHDRIMLMEEEEVENLVTRTRKEKGGRDTGLNLGNAFSIFGRKNRVHDESANTSTEDFSEKRRRRRSRRREKRERLREQAEHGEDGELMYEMEEGGMKDTSSTGESSEDSEEMDQKRLNTVAKAKADRKRNCRRWVLIHTIIVVAFSVFVVVAWKLSANRKRASVASQVFSNGTALFGPTTVIISLDGFRPDFLQRGITPRLNAFIKEGVSPKYMLPSFPSVTFPNHYTIATGLYPESHGIVGNTFYDPAIKGDFYYTDPSRSLDPKWWMGEPFWVTAEKQGVRSAIHMWPGSEAHILHTEPSFLDEYNGKELLPKKVDRLFEFLDMPGMENNEVDIKDTRPQLIAMYVPNVDGDGHTYGPNSTEINKTIKEVDTMLDQIFRGLEQRNLTNIVNIIVVSDHGMATTDVTRLTQLDDIVDLSKVSHIDGWPLVGLRPKDPEDLRSLYDQALNNTRDNPNIEVYLRDENMPERYHFSNNERIAPLWLIPKAGWGVVEKLEFAVADALAKGEVYHPRGMHGYDNLHPLMRAIFVARGPAFPHPPNTEVDVFQNINVYNMLCDSLGLTPAPNNGTLRLPLQVVGLHTDESFSEPLQDPEVTPSPSISGAPGKSIGVDPVTVSPSPTLEVGTPTEEKPSVPPSNVGDEDATEEEDESEIEKAESAIKDLWDWLTEKIEGLLNGIGGSR
ncbi:hypothetical protein jhhlp_003757 [Lomentospora prolificans]|uniref:Uncharacterized protein n=1 Tax=Lomentospora prolificans TaxID=41688 RepID=A0A2N3N9M4_9PEZI|nr:hypothetical protein jhhlp_003757 [Lomentospora prolificans]